MTKRTNVLMITQQHLHQSKQKDSFKIYELIWANVSYLFEFYYSDKIRWIHPSILTWKSYIHKLRNFLSCFARASFSQLFKMNRWFSNCLNESPIGSLNQQVHIWFVYKMRNAKHHVDNYLHVIY